MTVGFGLCKDYVATLKYETLTLPAVLNQYVRDGAYQIHLNNGITTYQSRISSGQVRFQGQLLHARGVEADDFVLLSFDMRENRLSVTFGDEDVFEKAKAPIEESDEPLA